MIHYKDAFFHSLFYIGLSLITVSVGSRFGYVDPSNLYAVGLVAGILLLFAGAFFSFRNKHSIDALFFIKSFLAILFGAFVLLYFPSPFEFRTPFVNFRFQFLFLIIITPFVYLLFRTRKLSSLKAIPKLIKDNYVAFFWLPVFVLFASPISIITTTDTFPARYLPFTLVENQTFSLDEYVEPFGKVSKSEFVKNPGVAVSAAEIGPDEYLLFPYFLVYREGKLYGSYPIIPGLFNSLVYSILKLEGIKVGKPHYFTQEVGDVEANYNYLEKFSSSLIAATTSLLFFLLLTRLVSIRTALLLSILYTFGTSHISTSSQTLWQHGFAELLLVSVLPFVLFRKKLSTFELVSFGVILGLFYFIRPTSILIMTAVALFYLWNTREILFTKEGFIRNLYITFGFLFISTLCMGINYTIYGDIQGGYGLFNKAVALNGVHLFGGTFLGGFFGLLVSPGFGLFTFSPVLLLILPALLWARKSGRSSMYVFCVACCLVYIGLYSFYFMWYGGKSYSARFLTDITPVFLLLLIPAFKLMKRSKSIFAFIFLFGIYSIFVHSSYPYKENPDDWFFCRDSHAADDMESSAWSWKRSPFLFDKGVLKRSFLSYQKSEWEILPADECHSGRLVSKGEPSDIYELKLNNANTIFIFSRRIDTYASKGDYCVSTYLGTKDITPTAATFLSVSRGNTIDSITELRVAEFKLGERLKRYDTEVHFAKSGFYNFNIRFDNHKSAYFGKVKITKGSCSNLKEENLSSLD